MKTTILYHIFTNERDEWEESFEIAEQLFEAWKKEYGCARLYEEIWPINKDGKIDSNVDEPLEENCLKSYGAYPY